MSHLLEDTLERIGRTISRRAGITITCRGNEAKTNGKEIILPSLPSPCPPDLERFWHGVLDHEVSHVCHSAFNIIERVRKRHGARGTTLLNALEDIRVEFLMEKEFPGSRDNLSFAYQQASKKWVEKIKDIALWDRVLATIIATARGYDNNIFGADVMRFVEPISDLIADVPHAGSTYEVAILASKIIRRWRHMLNIRHSWKERSVSNKAGDDAEKARQLFESVPTENGYSLGRSLQEAIIEGAKENPVQPYRVYDRSHDVFMTAPNAGPQKYEKILEEVRPLVGGLRQRLITTLRVKSRSRFVPDENGQKLNRKQIHNICLDIPRRPFMSKGYAPSCDVAVSLLIDLSGSMRNERISLAKACAVLLSETMEQIHMPLEVIGFSTTHDHSYLAELRKTAKDSTDDIERQFVRFVPLLHLVYKGFGEPLRKCKGRFDSMEARHYTPLNESILLAGKRIMEVKASRRIILALTDGACFLGSKSTQSVVHQNLLDNLELLRRAGFEVIGIGMNAPYVLNVFPRAINVRDITQLPHEFYRVISRAILNEK